MSETLYCFASRLPAAPHILVTISTSVKEREKKQGNEGISSRASLLSEGVGIPTVAVDILTQ